MVFFHSYVLIDSHVHSHDAGPLEYIVRTLKHLSAFFSKARQIVLPGDFERNIWQLLLKFAKTLRAEAGSKIESETTHVKISIKKHNQETLLPSSGTADTRFGP
jgi:hypothetical protein